MKKERILTTAFSITFIMLTFAVNIPAVHSKNMHEDIKSKKSSVRKPAKTHFTDKGDYYFLNTGDKKSFLREDDAYFIIYKRNTFASMETDDIENQFSEDIDIIREHRLKKLTKFKIKQGKKHKDIISALYRADSAISYISPGIKSRDKGGEMAVIPNITVRINRDTDRDHVIGELHKYHLSFVSNLSFTDSEFEVKIDGPVEDIGRIFEITRTIAELPFVQWAEPNFILSSERHFMPDDSLFNDQWHLHNTGQNGAAVDADVDAPEGWDVSRGSGSVIAIYDDGVDISHEDLTIWSNPGETGGGKETNGIDDDGNGYIDDYHGWDFSDNDNNPAPFTDSDNHGTSVAGVAGATGNNGMGVTGSAQNAGLLPVRMNSGLCSDFANAMRYAGKHADVVSNSWSISACESQLNSAIYDVVNGTITGARRGTKGTPVLFASGNNASGWRKFMLTGLWAGTWTFQWKYSKDFIIDSGYDTAWIDDVQWPGGSADFETDTAGQIPDGFSSFGHADWTVVSDGIHARGASGNSVKAGSISRNQYTTIETTVAVTGSGSLTFWHWVSSEQYYDVLQLYAVNGSTTYGPFLNYAPGQYGHDNDVGYPASNPDTIAVGASNDGGISGEEERSYYSQFGVSLDLVASSSGGGQGISTTDRTGTQGYNTNGSGDYADTNYTKIFGGTSSSTPLVSGIVADIISNNPDITASQIRTVLHAGADQIGPYPYSGGRNDFYGYGRVNLFNSLCPDGDGDGYTICENDCNDGDPAINPSASEVCDNADNNCDGDIDENLTQPTVCGTGECASTGFETCTAGVWGGDTCTPGTPTAEVCDNMDNNCDGSVDEGLQYLLITTVNPSGAGSINPDCSDSCTYDCMDSAVLNAMEDSGYPFQNWTGCTSVANNICTVTIDNDKIVSAVFDSCRYPARVLGAAIEYFSFLQGALNSASASEVVESQDYTFDEDIIYENADAVTFKAGYDCAYSIITGTTIVNGSVTIHNGSINLQSGTLVLR